MGGALADAAPWGAPRKQCGSSRAQTADAVDDSRVVFSRARTTVIAIRGGAELLPSYIMYMHVALCERSICMRLCACISWSCHARSSPNFVLGGLGSSMELHVWSLSPCMARPSSRVLPVVYERLYSHQSGSWMQAAADQPAARTFALPSTAAGSSPEFLPSLTCAPLQDYSLRFAGLIRSCRMTIGWEASGSDAFGQKGHAFDQLSSPDRRASSAAGNDLPHDRTKGSCPPCRSISTPTPRSTPPPCLAYWATESDSSAGATRGPHR